MPRLLPLCYKYTYWLKTNNSRNDACQFRKADLPAWKLLVILRVPLILEWLYMLSVRALLRLTMRSIHESAGSRCGRISSNIRSFTKDIMQTDGRLGRGGRCDKYEHIRQKCPPTALDHLVVVHGWISWCKKWATVRHAMVLLGYLQYQCILGRRHHMGMDCRRTRSRLGIPLHAVHGFGVLAKKKSQEHRLQALHSRWVWSSSIRSS